MISMCSATRRMVKLTWCTSGMLAVSVLSSPANKYTVFGNVGYASVSVEQGSRRDHSLYDGERAKAST